MEKKFFVKDIRPKDSISEVFRVKYLAVMKARDGRDYLNIIFADNSGAIEGRKWSGASEVSNKIKGGDLVKVTGKVNFYQNRNQIIIKEVSPVDSSSFEMADFVMAAKVPAEKMYEELVSLVGRLDDFYIKKLLMDVLHDYEIQTRLKTWQAGKTIHHAYSSGLLEHVLSCTNLAFYLSDVYKVNKNYVVAGAIMHDLCKVYELSEGPNVEYTDEGKLIGHLVKGVELVDHFAAKIENFPHQVKLHLKHVLLSHHGEVEYGSPKVPSTSEAMLLHLIDMMDSKMNAFEMIKSQDLNAGSWSGYVKHLDRMIYKDPLPFFDQAIESSDQSLNKSSKSPKPSAGPNLGSLLKDFKLEE